MYTDTIMTSIAARVVREERGGLGSSSNVVVSEPEWRTLPRANSSERGIIASRWQTLTRDIREAGAETPADGSVVKIVLRQTDLRLSVDGRVVHDGVIMPGTFHVSGPGTMARCLFRGPYDVVHLHVPNKLFAEHVKRLASHSGAAFHMAGRRPVRDHVVERLARTLLDVVPYGQFEQLYADCIGVAIVARILATAWQRPTPERVKISEAPPWRLKRAIEYFEAHLADPVSLADVAAVTGVTRMHFAAQFRAATGVSPHQYLLRRRVDKAQELLTKSDMSLVDIALAVGFQNQSHFTTVFKRFAGRTPSVWRRSRAS